MVDQAIALVENKAGGLSVAIMERCIALKLSEQDITAVTQLAEMPAGEPIDALLQYVEDGMTVPIIAECVRLRTDSVDIAECHIPSLGKIIEMIDFAHTNLVNGVEVDPSKHIIDGRQVTIDELEAIELERFQLRAAGKPFERIGKSDIITSSHDAIIDTLLEAVIRICGNADPAVFLANGLEQYFDSNPLMAYYVLEHDPVEFGSAMFAGLDPDLKEKLFEKLDDEDSDDFLRRIASLGITPESMGLTVPVNESVQPEDDEFGPEPDEEPVDEDEDEDFE